MRNAPSRCSSNPQQHPQILHTLLSPYFLVRAPTFPSVFDCKQSWHMFQQSGNFKTQATRTLAIYAGCSWSQRYRCGTWTGKAHVRSKTHNKQREWWQGGKVGLAGLPVGGGLFSGAMQTSKLVGQHRVCNQVPLRCIPKKLEGKCGLTVQRRHFQLHGATCTQL